MSTSERPLRASAPGKLMISGEYAVLDGAEAVVAAAGRRAFVRLLAPDARAPDQAELPREVQRTRALIEARFGPVPGALEVDVRALWHETGHILADGTPERRKLGLGSSAAASAAAAGVLLSALGHDPRAPETRALALELALAGHRAVSPEGSGADVAASVLGGFLRVRRLGEGLETHPIVWPEGLHTVVVWTGKSARTSDFVAAVRTLERTDRAAYRACMGALADQADQLVSALIDADAPAIVEAFHAYGGAMRDLGEAAKVGIVEDTITKIRALARSHGGGAKPSGAGGGDVVLAAFSSEQASQAFRAACEQAEVGCAQDKFEVLSIALGVPGERDEES